MTPCGSERVIALATSSNVPELTGDDRLLVRALASAGVSAVPAIWDDCRENWHRYAAVVIRSCWDYHLKHGEFLAWLHRLETTGVRVLNSPALVRWNAEKTYLRELAACGVASVPTRWVERDDLISLDAILHAREWDRVVVKPAISASAHETWRASSASAHAAEPRFRLMVTNGEVLVQPFLDVVQSDGEWSLLFYGGVYSHSVLKRPRPGDFRVQREHGGTSEALVPSREMIAAARGVLRVAEQGRSASLYARVDGCVIERKFVLMELELIEPDLYLRSNDAAPDRLAAALLDVLQT